MQRELRASPAADMARANVKEITDRIDAITGNTTPATLQPPTYGAAQRGAIKSISDDLARDGCQKLSALRARLDRLQENLLRAVANAQHGMSELVSVCVEVDDETHHMDKIIADIEARVEPLARD